MSYLRTVAFTQVNKISDYKSYTLTFREARVSAITVADKRQARRARSKVSVSTVQDKG